MIIRFSWPSALLCNPCPAPCSPGNVPTPTPATLMDMPSVKIGHHIFNNTKGLSRVLVVYYAVVALFLHDSRETPETAVSLLHQKRLGSGSEPTNKQR